MTERNQEQSGRCVVSAADSTTWPVQARTYENRNADAVQRVWPSRGQTSSDAAVKVTLFSEDGNRKTFPYIR